MTLYVTNKLHACIIQELRDQNDILVINFKIKSVQIPKNIHVPLNIVVI